MTDDHVTAVFDRSRRSGVRAGALALFTALTATGCIVEHDHTQYVPVDNPPQCLPPPLPAATVGIDADNPLQSPPGQGAGVFIEYAAGGHWHVWTSCDTQKTGLACNFDVLAQVTSGAVTNVQGEALESGDAVYWTCTDTAELLATTTNDTDGMYFDAPAGTGVEIDVRVDGSPEPQLVYWYGNFHDGADSYVHYGAPGNPVLVLPNSP